MIAEPRRWEKRWEGECPECETINTIAGFGKGPRSKDPQVGDMGEGACCACGLVPIPMRCVFVGWERPQ